MSKMLTVEDVLESLANSPRYDKYGKPDFITPPAGTPSFPEPSYKVVDGNKNMQNPIVFKKMATLAVLFKVTKKEAEKFKKEPYPEFFFFHSLEISYNHFRVDIHSSLIQLDKKNEKAGYMVQYDLEMEASDVDKFLEMADEYASLWKFDAIRRRAFGDDDQKDRKCHLKPVESHGCACAKHVKAFQETFVLLRCNTCTKPNAADTMKKEEKP